MVSPFESIGRGGEFSFTDDLYTGDRVYDVFDAADEYTAVTDALTQFQADVGNTVLFGSPISTISFDETDKKDHYRVRFHFRPLEPLPPQQVGDGPRTEFEFSDDADRRFYSFATTAYGASIDFGGAIGVKKNSNGRFVVEGADVPGSNFNWGKRIVVASSVITNAFVTGLADLVGTVNNDTFYDFPANEVLLRGVSGSTKSANEFELHFRFSQRPNVSNLNIGGVLGDANGWDIIDPFYADVEYYDFSTAQWVTYVYSVFVHRVRNQGDFSNLPV